jgi:Tfp pilus assembly protein PilV
VTAAAVIDRRRGRWSRLVARLRNEDGVGLVELLIAILVLNVGIFATIGAFTSAGAAVRRASRISTATAIADQEMESLRNVQYSSIAATTINPWPSAPDGRSYKVVVTQVSTGSQSGGTYPGSSSVKVMKVTVTDNNDGAISVANLSTFSRCDQSGLGTDTGTTPCQS